MKKAVAIIAYARSAYFERVLASILLQRVGDVPLIDCYDLHLFQDGLWDGENDENRAGHARIAAMIDELGDRVVVHRQQENLAVARHFDFAERKLFLELGYDLAVFFEDDMVLAPGYMTAMDLMATRFRGDARIGMFSANPEVTTRPLDDQKAGFDRYDSMGHNWGFGLFRDFWIRRQVFVDLYLQWTHAFAYRKRPVDDIVSWLASTGFRPLAASQDYAKQCATVALGAVRVATYANHGIPIGETGLHCRPEDFRKMGFDRTIVVEDIPESAAALSEEHFAEIFGKQAGMIIADPATFDRAIWATLLATGRFDPASRIAETLARRAALTGANAGDVIACYRLFLNRPPENASVVEARKDLALPELMASFLNSSEFASRKELASLFDDAAVALGAARPDPDAPVRETELRSQVAQLERKVGQLTMQLDTLRDSAHA